MSLPSIYIYIYSNVTGLPVVTNKIYIFITKLPEITRFPPNNTCGTIHIYDYDSLSLYLSLYTYDL